VSVAGPKCQSWPGDAVALELALIVHRGNGHRMATFHWKLVRLDAVLLATNMVTSVRTRRGPRRPLMAPLMTPVLLFDAQTRRQANRASRSANCRWAVIGQRESHRLHCWSGRQAW